MHSGRPGFIILYSLFVSADSFWLQQICVEFCLWKLKTVFGVLLCFVTSLKMSSFDLPGMTSTQLDSQSLRTFESALSVQTQTFLTIRTKKHQTSLSRRNAAGGQRLVTAVVNVNSAMQCEVWWKLGSHQRSGILVRSETRNHKVSGGPQELQGFPLKWRFKPLVLRSLRLQQI